MTRPSLGGVPKAPGHETVRRPPDSGVLSWTAWLRVKPPHGVALGKAELANALHCLLARQRGHAPVVREVSAIPFHDLVKLGAKAFIRGGHYMDMASQYAVGKSRVDRHAILLRLFGVRPWGWTDRAAESMCAIMRCDPARHLIYFRSSIELTIL